MKFGLCALGSKSPRIQVLGQQCRFESQATPYLKNTLRRALRRDAPLDIHPEVQDALSNHRPVVALESTIITHGMPPPVNLETALSVENIVRSTGAVPATIGVIGGRVKIGLHRYELERLADSGGNTALVKISRRDIGASIALKKDGGTTCSATLIFAGLAGIKVFSTGGLGGVHRGGENSFDISADLHELARYPVALVSAGVKSILDIGRTLEYLETLGVPVVTYGDTEDFPAFYAAKSGFKSPWRVNDPRTAAEIMMSQWQLGLENGVLYGVPIPRQHHAEATEIQTAVKQAIREADENGISKRGKEVTPWLLSRVGEITRGKSLRSNVGLIENTAAVGGKLAVEYAHLQNKLHNRPGGDSLYISGIDPHSPSMLRPMTPKNGIDTGMKPSAELIVVGASAIDITATVGPSIDGSLALGMNSTAPGSVALSTGGVGRNIAEAAHRVLSSGTDRRPFATLLLSPVGDDQFARSILEEHKGIGMRTDGLIKSSRSRTAVCNMVLDVSGALIGGVADMDAIQNVDPERLLRFIREHVPAMVAMDANASPPALTALLDYCNEHGIATFYEPTSVVKSAVILAALPSSLGKLGATRSPVTFASPNLLELSHMYHQARGDQFDLMNHEVWWMVIDKFGLDSNWRSDIQQLARQPICPSHLTDSDTLSFLVDDGIAQMAINLLPLFQNLVIKCGPLGIVVAMRISGQDARESGWIYQHSDPSHRTVITKGPNAAEIVILKHFPPVEVDDKTIINVTGAGDSLVGSLCAGLIRNPAAFHDPKSLDTLMRLAQEAAVLSLQSRTAISPLLGSTVGHLA